MGNDWALSLFKGRIGEAIVESILQEFGYTVRRIGQEFKRISRRPIVSRQRYRADLKVVDRDKKTTEYIEAKLRSAHPTSVSIEKYKLDGLKEHYRRTILVFVSSYDGTVKCARVSDLKIGKKERNDKSYYEFNLLSEDWKPIWHFFSRIREGEELTRLLNDIKEHMHNFALGNRVNRL